jgi:hypothetical protein
MQHRCKTGLVCSVVSALVALAAGAGPALAQRMPDMATLDRGDGISRLGLDFGAAFVDEEAGDDNAALRFDFFGQFVTHQGFGVYGTLPLSRALVDGEDESAIGNIDVGGLYVIESPTLSLVFRGGVALPTADDDVDGFLTNYFATWTRLTDAALAIPNVTYLRLGFSPLFHANRLFLRADVGFDLAVAEDDDATGFEPGNLFRINVGGGFDLGSVALMAELVSLATTEDFDEFSEEEEDFIHTFAVSARFMGEMLQPYATFGMPVDTYGLDTVDFFFGAGLQVAF